MKRRQNRWVVQGRHPMESGDRNCDIAFRSRVDVLHSTMLEAKLLSRLPSGDRHHGQRSIDFQDLCLRKSVGERSGQSTIATAKVEYGHTGFENEPIHER